MTRKEILNAYYKVLLPVGLLRRYESLSIKFNRGLATTLRNVLAATIDEAETAGKKLYKFSPEEDQFDELARQADEGADAEDVSGASAGSQAQDNGDAQHAPEDPAGGDTEVGEADGPYVDDGAPEGGGKPPASSQGKAGRARKARNKGR